MLKEFRDFAVKGNMLDLAIGVIIGGAFGKVVSSIVADVVLPPIGLLVGGINFTEIKVHLKDAVVDPAGKTVQEAVNLNLGNFIQSLVDFSIIAFTIFIMIKLINRMVHNAAALAPPAAPSRQEQLLEEIRDLLKKG
jgi:large conductance mechanosensitive channel